MITVNMLANLLPINGLTTGQVSQHYPNLFAPAGITFSIWGLIYFLLALFIIWQVAFWKKDDHGLIKAVSSGFIISSWSNGFWIFSWHYKIMPLSMVLILIILISLALVNTRLYHQTLTKKERLFVKLPFSVYFGWITVATIANAMVLSVSLGWDGWGISREFWTIFALVAGIVIAAAIIRKRRDVPYGAVIIWAYGGILLKHYSQSGYAGKYPLIIYTVIASIVAVILLLISIAPNKKKSP
ncbi:MAG: tryptophan-rich sensory protein [Peptococcaceae bacterium]|nr:tryptophan-rich sensory protein [Peptococcaceae bacterium]